ncbi:MAG: C40 family peptidase [Reichenbachiella sp.]
MSELVKGIGRLGVVPMYEKPGHKETLISELLFGEHYSVLSSNQDWFKIQLSFDQSEGWIHQNQHFTISDAYYDQINMSDYKVCTDISGSIFFQKKYVNILLGSILPISSNELFKIEEQVAFNGSSKSLSQQREFEFVKGIAEKYRHTPFRHGGKTPFGVDKAGFIQQVFKISGYRLKRSLDEQMESAEECSDLTKIEEGDILYIGKGKNITALIALGGEQFIGIIDGQVEKISNLNIGKEKFLVRKMIRNSHSK